MLNSSSFTGAGIVISVSDPAMALPFGLYHAALYTEMRSHKRFPCWSSVGGIKNVTVIKPRIYFFG